MVSALNSGSRGPSSRADWGHCPVFWGNTTYSHTASLHPILTGSIELNAVLLWQLLHASETGHKHQPDGSISLYADLTLKAVSHSNQKVDPVPNIPDKFVFKNII